MTETGAVPARKASPRKAAAQKQAAVREAESAVQKVDTSRQPEVDVPGILGMTKEEWIAENPLGIHQAILQVMETVGAIRKTQYHDAPGAKFNFRGVDQVVNAVQPAFLAVGVTIAPKLLSKQLKFSVPIGGQQKPASWAEVEMRYTLTARDGSFVEWEVPGAAMDSGDKALGKACSVAYRIAMLQGLCIPTDEPDPDDHQPALEDDGYQTHGRAQNSSQRGAQRQEEPNYAQPDPAVEYANKLRAYTMNTVLELGWDKAYLGQRWNDLHPGVDYFAVTDADLLTEFGRTMKEEATMDKAQAEEQAVANVIGGLGGTVVSDDNDDSATQ